LLFVWTFLEQHLWLLPGVFADPVVDRRIEWKATGALVGSFNLFVYGTVIWLGERLSGDARYGQSRLAWSLFGIGLLNSFTNYAHHTYHLPQSHLVKQVSFGVSMLEIAILWRAIRDVALLARDRTPRPYRAVRAFLTAGKWWSAAMLLQSVLISVPPLNSVIHGTYVVTSHAMGTMIGIDSMVLLGATAFLLGERHGDAPALDGPRSRAAVVALNAATGLLVTWLSVVGVADGLARIGTPATVPQAAARAAWVHRLGAPVFAVVGLAAAGALGWFLLRWGSLAFARDAPERATSRG
jgi:nitric oxide reductase subunit B